jgi:hypothetical protein
MTIDDFLNSEQKESSDTITGHYGLDEDKVFERVKYILKATDGSDHVSDVIDACNNISDSHNEAMVLMHSVYMAKFSVHMNEMMSEMASQMIRGFLGENDDE